jgi:hypothetical protein
MGRLSGTRVLVALLVLPGLAGCSRFEPRPLDEPILLRRAQSRIDGGVNVTVAPLSAEEARVVLGFDVERSGIQPLWVKVVNREPVRWFLPPITIDSEYFSPLEVAWQGHRPLAAATNRRIDAHLTRLGLPGFVEPLGVTSGLVFTNLDEGIKYTNLELVGSGPQAPVRRFSFLTEVPGHATDFQKVNWNGLYPSAKVRDLDERAFRHWLEQDVPCCALGGDRRTPADPLNVVIVGSRDTVFPALAQRGWHVTQTLSVTSLWRTVRSALLGGRYRYAPVSPLYLFGRRQDMALQKGRTDVNQRNHMRLWLAPVTLEGRPVWVGQISRDIGVRLTTRTITTHKIDPSVDETRWYLLQDLFFSEGLARFGFVGGVGVSRSEQPRTNYTGDPYVTDGRRAVFWMVPQPIRPRQALARWIPFRQRTASDPRPAAPAAPSPAAAAPGSAPGPPEAAGRP